MRAVGVATLPPPTVAIDEQEIRTHLGRGSTLLRPLRAGEAPHAPMAHTSWLHNATESPCTVLCARQCKQRITKCVHAYRSSPGSETQQRHYQTLCTATQLRRELSSGEELRARRSAGGWWERVSLNGAHTVCCERSRGPCPVLPSEAIVHIAIIRHMALIHAAIGVVDTLCELAYKVMSKFTVHT